MRLTFSYAPVYIEDSHRRRPQNPNSLCASTFFDCCHNLLGLILDALHLASAALGDSILTTTYFCCWQVAEDTKLVTTKPCLAEDMNFLPC